MDRFRLPPWHPLFREQSLPEILEVFITDKLALRDQLLHEVQDPNLSLAAKSAMRDQIAAIEKLAHGEEAVTEDILDEVWEAQIAAGLEPDLDLTVEEARRMKYGSG